MAPHARKQPLSFDPVIDTVEWRRAQMDRIVVRAREFAAEQEPLSAAESATLDAKMDAMFVQLDEIEAKFAEAEVDA